MLTQEHFHPSLLVKAAVEVIQIDPAIVRPVASTVVGLMFPRTAPAETSILMCSYLLILQLLCNSLDCEDTAENKSDQTPALVELTFQSISGQKCCVLQRFSGASVPTSF